MAGSVESFIQECREVASRYREPAEAVEALAPRMHRFLREAERYLRPEHLRSDPAHYARNAIYIAPEGDLSLFALVWSPGQWTPIHDHGSWGVVGICRGTLQERNYVRVDGSRERDEGIELKRGGVFLLDAGSVTSFVPNPDHIHVTGLPEQGEPVVSLHLYGRNLDSFHIYDVEARSRRRISVPYNES